MGLVLTAAPAVEPVTVDEAKAHLRIDHGDEDDFLGSLISTSRLHIEAALGVALITQSWSWQFDAWPESAVGLPLSPVQSVETIIIKQADGMATELSPDDFIVDGASRPARLIPASGGWPRPGVPVLGITVAFTAGFGSTAEEVPAPLRQALLMLVAHWHEHREPVAVGTAATRIPDTVSALLTPFRMVRL